MKQGKYQIMELFLYIAIVVIGIIMLLCGGEKQGLPASDPTPPAAQVSIMSEERSEP